VERGPIGIFWSVVVRRSSLSAFPAAIELSGAAAALPHARHSTVDSRSHRGGVGLWHYFLDLAQEKSVGLDWNTVGLRCGGIGWIKRPDQRVVDQWTRHWIGLVLAGHFLDGADLRAQTEREHGSHFIGFRVDSPGLKRHGGFSLGTGVGTTWSKDKFNIPYLRDYIMDYGCMADVAETSTLWSNVLPLYAGTVEAVKARFSREDGKGYIGCHISHTYKTGACLYFTFAARQPRGQELDHYYAYKRLITDTILQLGGTLSHHHAVGIEQRPWVAQEISPVGLQALHALKTSVDPRGVLNPGKLLPAFVDGR
jgi:FAD/FMN-containing dehydrogenase